MLKQQENLLKTRLKELEEAVVRMADRGLETSLERSLLEDMFIPHSMDHPSPRPPLRQQLHKLQKQVGAMKMQMKKLLEI